MNMCVRGHISSPGEQIAWTCMQRSSAHRVHLEEATRSAGDKIWSAFFWFDPQLRHVLCRWMYVHTPQALMQAAEFPFTAETSAGG